ncbi:MAG: cbb3-type cytochrome c oxidase subunit 3 [Burkholderiaceae bacterium]|nr:cbb3-type cytochrome c oxidase subunit 3 [Burkholderiaceae bacterium]
MDITTMRVGVTLISFVVFIGIWAWAYARKNQAQFDEAAQLPFLQD